MKLTLKNYEKIFYNLLDEDYDSEYDEYSTEALGIVSKLWSYLIEPELNSNLVKKLRNTFSTEIKDNEELSLIWIETIKENNSLITDVRHEFISIINDFFDFEEELYDFSYHGSPDFKPTGEYRMIPIENVSMSTEIITSLRTLYNKFCNYLRSNFLKKVYTKYTNCKNNTYNDKNLIINQEVDSKLKKLNS